MPKVPTAKVPECPSASLFVLKHGAKRVLIQRPKSFKLAINSACRYFPCLVRGRVALQTKDLDISDGHWVELTEESWPVAINAIHSIEVVEHKPTSDNDDSAKAGIPRHHNITDDSAPVQNPKISVKCCYNGQLLNVKVGLSTHMYKIMHVACAKFGLEEENTRAFFAGGSLHPQRTIADCELEDGDIIDLHPERLGGKPIIYIFSPTEIDATITLSLIPEWELSAIYPVVPIKKERGDQIEWQVRTHQDGSLTETQTGLDVAYLFWEAETNSGLPPSPPRSPAHERAQTIETFNPVSADLCDADSVVLSVDKVTPYLDEALKALGLHTEARTSFITYWLPSILKHKYVALRFVPQAAYEFAAPLNITPQPEVVTRVFMLFKGVQEAQEWTGARARADADVDWWRNVVGVDAARASNSGLYRVLEWGGMEVLKK